MSVNSTKIDKSLEFRPQTVAPVSPAIGEIYNSATLGLLQWTGAAWVPVGSANVPQVALTLANNQASAADLTGLLIDQATNKSFRLDYMIRRRHAGAPFSGGTDDATFVPNTLGGAGATLSGAVIQPSDSKILVFGNFTTFNGVAINRLARLNADGSMDTAFNTNIGTGFAGQINEVVVQTDGKILVSGPFSTFNGNTRNSLVRLNSDGTEDTAFYTNLGTAFTGGGYVRVNSTGKIVVAGGFTTFNGNARNRIVRLNSDGTEDAAFYTALGTGINQSVLVVRIDSSDRILVGGAFSAINGTSLGSFARILDSGSLDTTFNTNLGTGFAQPVIPGGICIQSDNKIVVSGTYTSFKGVTRNRIVRLNADGTEDTAFYTALGSAANNDVYMVLQRSNGKLLAVGSFTTWNGATRNRAVALNSDGTLDTAFNTNMGTGPDATTGMVVQQGTKIILSGNFANFNGNARGRIIRLAEDGLGAPTLLYEKGSVQGYYNIDTTTWEIGDQEFIGSDSGILISITSAGQMQYTSTNILGTVTESSLTGALYKL